jgi:D-alanyl-lipoteichoic acid acyltransferase DltB (MBOAT superfamily)
MIFSSFSFLFLFLPLVWAIYWSFRARSGEAGFAVLTAASLFFYGYWDIRFVPLLLFSIVVNFALGRLLHDRLETGNTKTVLALGVFFNLGLLAFFKYANFFSDTVEYLTGTDPISIQILLPIGISFFTFQQITYLVDASRGTVPRYSLLHYMLFVSFFPQLIAGPIVHHSEMMPQFLKAQRKDWTMIAVGIAILTAGLFKKLVLADNLSPYTIAIFGAVDGGLDVGIFEVWGALVAFSFQLYFDFSGYCDMAIGLGLMFGIRLPINFNSPYKAMTIAGYWRRWNMTLGRFLQRYLYIPLGGGGHGETARLRNLMIVMTVSGVWHGAGLGFILWGALNGFWLWCNYASARFHKAIGREGQSVIPKKVAVAMMFLAVTLGWTLFRPRTVDGMKVMWNTALGFNGVALPEIFAAYFGDTAEYFRAIGVQFSGPAHVSIGAWSLEVLPLMLISAFIIWVLPNTNQLFLSLIPDYETDPARIKVTWRPTWIGYAATATTFMLAMLFAGTISEFLYFQF